MTQLAKTPPRSRAQAIRDGNILNKDMTARAYDGGMNVSRFLESLDPTEDHDSQRLGTDAFQRVLRACGIRTRSVPEMGIAASTLEDVVNHPQAQFLAVELFARAYRGAAFGNKGRAPITSFEGTPGQFLNQFAYPAPRSYLLQPAIALTEVVGQTTGINQTYYKPFFLQDVANASSRVAEGAEIPAVRIATSEKVITLKKYGRRLDVTYESIRQIPIDMLSFYVQRIAVKVETEKVDKVLSVIINGDGNANTAATNYNLTALDSGTTANNLTLKAWLAFKMKFVNPLVMTTVIAQDTSILSLMLLNSNSANIPLVNLGASYLTGQVSPINAGLADGVRAGWLASAPSGVLVGFDKRLSIERIFEIGGSIQETDKDVKSQINSLVLSEVEGYGVLDPNANKTLTLTA